jgi:hypothetical protein
MTVPEQTSPAAERPKAVPALARGQAMEFWFWCWAAAEEMRRRLERDSSNAQVRRWRLSACLRVQTAFERSHQDGSCYPGFHDPLDRRLTRGLDPLGVALFARYLLQQHDYWRARTEVGGEDERLEAQVRLLMVVDARLAFIDLVEMGCEEIDLAADALSMKGDRRAGKVGVKMGDVVILDEAGEGPIPREEEDARMKAALDAVRQQRKEPTP